MVANSLKISVLTPVYNGENMIRHCMDSVTAQTYTNKEHIIVDGLSRDNTVAVINANKGAHVKLLSEKDRGLYDAFNKGIELASGDIICFLCADDMYAHDKVLQTVADAFGSNPEAGMIYGDIVYVNRNDLSKVVRYWRSSAFHPGIFKNGWMAPNTALFIRRDLFAQYGVFNLKFKMASDYDLQFRFFEKHRVGSVHIPGILVRMRSGGVSNSGPGNIYKSLRECYDALLDHQVRFPWIYILNTLFYRLKQTRIPAEVKRLNSGQVNLLLKNRAAF